MRQNTTEEEGKRRCAESTSLTSVRTTNGLAPAWTTTEGDYTDDSNRDCDAKYFPPAMKRLELIQIQGHIENLPYPAPITGQKQYTRDGDSNVDGANDEA